MQSIQIGKLKTEFSSIIQRVQNSGEEFIIEYGKQHKKVALLIPYDKSYENKEDRVFGIMKGKASFKINDDFSMSDEELLGI